MKAPLKGAWVQEETLRPGKPEEFWVLTSLEELTAEEIEALFGKGKLPRRFLQQHLRDSGAGLPVPDT